MVNLNVKGFIKIFIIFILIDLIWIKFIAGPKYSKMINDIQGEPMKIKYIPAIIVYVFMTVLFMLFSSQSNIRNFLLGFLSYGIYDFTNLALLNKFDKTFALLDALWGGVLFAVTYQVALKINF